jgi:hypothetical protein
MGLDDKGARLHPRAELMPDKRTVDEAQRRIRLEVQRQMMVEVGRVISSRAQDASALGLPRFRSPERPGTRQRPGRQRDPRREASLEQISATHTLDDTGVSLRCFHTSPSFLTRTGGAAQQRALHRIPGLICETYDTAAQLQRQT